MMPLPYYYAHAAVPQPKQRKSTRRRRGRSRSADSSSSSTNTYLRKRQRQRQMSDNGRPSRACGSPPRSAVAEIAEAQTQPIAVRGAGDLPGYESGGGVCRLTKRLTSKTFVDDVSCIPAKFADSMRAKSSSFPHTEPSWDSLPDVPSMLETIQLFAADCDDASMAKWQQMLWSAYPSMRDLDVGQQIYNLAR